MPTPPSQVNYGYDLGMGPSLQDLDPNMGEVSGRTVLIQSCIRRLITYRGTLIYDPNYGTDVRTFLNDDIDTRKLGQFGAAVDAEMRKDQRILRSNTTVSFVGGVLILSIGLVDQAGPFSLTLSISDVSVSLLKVQA